MTTTPPIPTWLKTLPGGVIVCDKTGVILALNDQSAETYKDDGGYGLIGCNVLDCHPEPSRSKLAEMMSSQQANVYTIEKQGVKKLIYQTPWYAEDGAYGGFLELSLPIPFEMPHFIRDKAAP